jgi:signal peptidase
MAGMIDSGSIVIIQKLPTEEIASTISEGDIICYQYRQIEITHRVISFHDNAAGERVYITKGDANPAEDINPVEMKQVVGIVRSKIPYIGYPALLVRNFLGGYPDIS